MNEPMFKRMAKPTPPIIAIINCPYARLVTCSWNIKIDIEHLYDNFETINTVKNIIQNHLKEHITPIPYSDLGAPDLSEPNGMDL